MRTVFLFLFAFSVLAAAGCGSSGPGLPAGANYGGSVLYNDSGDSVDSGTAIFDNGTDSYRAEISDGSFHVSVPAGMYKVWFENLEPFPAQKQYLSLEKTPLKVEVSGGQQIVSLQVYSDGKAKKRKK
jgi:hypothetical protein